MGGNNAPILLTDVPQPIATFNKPFELSELVGNLDGVMMLYNGNATSVECVSYEETGQTKYALADTIGQSNIGYLSVDGNTLLCSSGGIGNYLFDIDFKHQNRKFFEKASGTYLLKYPIFAAQGSSDPAEWIYPVVNIDNYLDADADLGVSFYVVSAQDPEPMCAKADYTDIDAADWVAGTSATTAISLFEKLVRLEYNLPPQVTVSIDTLVGQVPTIQGDWNPFTDGSEYVPLVMTSRFPGGSPIILDNTERVVATFNRHPEIYELRDTLNFAIEPKWNTTTAFAEVTDNGFLLKVQGPNTVIAAIIISGSNMSLIKQYSGDVPNVYDIDFDHQFRRSLPTSDFKYNVQLPKLLDNPSTGQGIGIKHVAVNRGEFSVFCQSGTNDPRVIENDTMGLSVENWANSMTWANVQSLLRKIIAMEFEGFDDTQPSITSADYSEQEATGFTVTPLIPKTIS